MKPILATFRSKVLAIIAFGPRLHMVLGLALLLRVIASAWVQFLATKQGTVCIFGDTPIYWQYARALAHGSTYVVYQWDVPHYALRTLGYPVWLAGWLTVFGEWALPIRLGQALLGTAAVLWVFSIAKELGFSEPSARWSAALVALDPFQILSGTLILTESLFTPLLVLMVHQSLKWTRLSIGPNFLPYMAFGVLQAVLTLIRPAWLPFLVVPSVLIVAQGIWAHDVRRSMAPLVLLLFGWSVVMAPWAVRNQRLIGRLAIGGTWGGASLFDGVRPGATGASDMSFVAEDQFRNLGETEQDDLWKSLSYREIRQNPARVARLAVTKQARFWSAWPNDSAKVPFIAKLCCALMVWPVWGLMAAGFWKNRHNPLIYVVLAPLFFTAALHLLFVGSSRYRLAVIIPATVLAGEGILILWNSQIRLGKNSKIQ
jgi:hypothetical protein